MNSRKRREIRFDGNDDFWAYIDGQLCMDLRGVHSDYAATLNALNPNSVEDEYQRTLRQDCVQALTPGNVYELSTLYAERQIHAER